MAPSTDAIPALLDTTGHPGDFVVLHSLTALSSAAPNRGLDGKPKHTYLGGTKRMRVSAQALARAMRTQINEWLRLQPGDAEAQTAVRTRELPSVVARTLADGHDVDALRAEAAAAWVLSATGCKILSGSPGRTQVTLLVRRAAADELARIAAEALHGHADAVAAVEREIAEGRAAAEKAKTKKETARIATTAPAELARAAESAIAPGESVQLALFGRRLDEMPEETIHSSVQIAHGVGTGVYRTVTDEWSVKDDLWDDLGTAGAANMGEQELTSGTLYRYTALDRGALRASLRRGTHDEDTVEELARWGEKVLLTAAAYSFPSGMVNRTGHPSPPTLLVAAATGRPCAADAAFDEPAENTRDAAAALARQVRRTHRLFNYTGGIARWAGGGDAPELPAAITVED